MRLIECTVDPSETAPHDFRIKLPEGASISNINIEAYDVSDDSSSDVSSTIVDASGILGSMVRVSFHGMTQGKVYAVVIESSVSTGGTSRSIFLVACDVDSITLEEIPEASRKTYRFDLSKKLPSSLSVNNSGVVYQAYDEADLTKTDVGSTLVARTLSSGLLTEIDFENGVAGKRYVILCLLPTSVDSVTSASYNIALRLLLPCGAI